MKPAGRLRTLAVALRLWAEKPTMRVLVALLAIGLIGPLGEVVDAVLVSEMEVELLTTDFGLEFLSTLFLSGYQALLLLLAGTIVVSGTALIRCDAPILVPALVSRRPGPISKIPIR